MKSRTKKYLNTTKPEGVNKKGSANNAGYDEQNEITHKAAKKNPAQIEPDDIKSNNVSAKAKTSDGKGK